MCADGGTTFPINGMRIGIHLIGLDGEKSTGNVRLYAQRFLNELEQNTTARRQFRLAYDRFRYGNATDQECEAITVIEMKGESEEPVYRFYGFDYELLLTERYRDSGLLKRAWMLFGAVFMKGATVIMKLFSRKASLSARARLQSLYALVLLLIISLSGILLIPAGITLVGTMLTQQQTIALPFELTDPQGGDGGFKPLVAHVEGDTTLFRAASDSTGTGALEFFTRATKESAYWTWLAGIIGLGSSIVLSLLPGGKALLATLATQFTCAHYYFSNGDRRQRILGQLDKLIERVCEEETDPRIHFHCYSFGSLLTLDLLYPVSGEPGKHVLERVEALCTIGCPYDIVRMYYPDYTRGRSSKLTGLKHWLNIYSSADILGSNFRLDSNTDQPNYHVAGNALQADNMPYEPQGVQGNQGLLSFLTLYAMKAHEKYWDDNPDGQSCVRDVVKYLLANELLLGAPKDEAPI
jgi:hypothetical protein